MLFIEKKIKKLKFGAVRRTSKKERNNSDHKQWVQNEIVLFSFIFQKMLPVLKPSLWWPFNSPQVSWAQRFQYHTRGWARDNTVTANTTSDKHIFEMEYVFRNKANAMPIPSAATVIIKHKYDNETRRGNQTGEMTVNISAVFVL